MVLLMQRSTLQAERKSCLFAWSLAILMQCTQHKDMKTVNTVMGCMNWQINIFPCNVSHIYDFLDLSWSTNWPTQIENQRNKLSRAINSPGTEQAPSQSDTPSHYQSQQIWSMFSSLQWLAWSYSCIRARMIVLILYIMITITAVHDHGQFDNSDWLGLSVIAIAPNLWKLSMSYSHPWRHPPTW